MAERLIQLTKFGDILRTDPDSTVTERSHIRSGIKWHGSRDYRCCAIEVVEISSAYYRLVCQRCGTLVVIPSRFQTYGGAESWCADSIENEKPENQWGLEDGRAFDSIGQFQEMA